jgi:magnesium-transporting ATPase (P-type)
LFAESAPFSGVVTDEILNKHFSELFNISSISIITIFLTFYIFNNCIVYSNKKHNEYKLESIKKLFSNHKLKLYLAFLAIVVLFISLNFFFSIAVRGKKYQEFDIGVSIFKTFLFFGFYFIVCI